MKRLFDLSVALFCIGSFFRSVQGIYADMQPGIIHYPENISSPNICWEWAQKTACDKNFSNGYWVGYSIKKMMNKNSFLGCCSHHNKDKISLYEMINGIEWEQASPQYTEDELLKQVVEKAFLNHEKWVHNSNILKEVALLFLFTGESDKMPSLKDIQISNMDLHVDLKNLPLIWLGNFNDNESIPFLHRMYSKSDYLKKKFMVAVAIHGSVNVESSAPSPGPPRGIGVGIIAECAALD